MNPKGDRSACAYESARPRHRSPGSWRPPSSVEPLSALPVRSGLGSHRACRMPHSRLENHRGFLRDASSRVEEALCEQSRRVVVIRARSPLGHGRRRAVAHLTVTRSRLPRATAGVTPDVFEGVGDRTALEAMAREAVEVGARELDPFRRRAHRAGDSLGRKATDRLTRVSEPTPDTEKHRIVHSARGRDRARPMPVPPSTARARRGSLRLVVDEVRRDPGVGERGGESASFPTGASVASRSRHSTRGIGLNDRVNCHRVKCRSPLFPGGPSSRPDTPASFDRRPREDAYVVPAIHRTRAHRSSERYRVPVAAGSQHVRGSTPWYVKPPTP